MNRSRAPSGRRRRGAPILPLSTWLLARTVHPDDADAVLGDLHAEYRARCGRDGRRRARSWFRRQARRSLWPLLARRWLDRSPTPKRSRNNQTRGAPMERLVREIRFAARALAKSPGFTTITILALAIGIGASSSVFSVVDVLLIRPLPYQDPDRLVAVWENDLEDPTTAINDPSPANFIDWRRSSSSFEHLAAIASDNAVLTGTDEPERLDGYRVSAGFFQAFGVEAAAGRAFTDDEDVPGSDSVVILADSLWQRRFARDPEVVGETVTMAGIPRVVVGVMPPDFQFPSAAADYWVPMAFGADEGARRRSHYLRVVGRLAADTSIESAAAEMSTIASRLAIEHPESNAGNGILVRPLRAEIVGDATPTLVAVFGAIAFVLLIACANVANLTLTRAVDRDAEISVRAALGASRADIVVQLLVESCLVAVAGGAAGLAITAFGARLMAALAPADSPVISQFGIDARVVAFTATLSMATVLLFGLAPAIRASRPDLGAAMQGGSRGTSAGRGQQKLRSSLAAVELALALVLVFGAGLLLRSFSALNDVDPGFRSGGLLTLRLEFSGPRYDTLEALTGFYDQVLDRVLTVPGVESAGMTTFLPMRFSGGSIFVSAENSEAVTAEDPVFPVFRTVSPGYHETMGIRVRGRTFTERDRAGSMPVAVVNEAFARAFWPGEDVVGKRIKNGRPDSAAPWMTIVGVTDDVRQFEMEARSRPEVHVSYLQSGDQGFFMPRDLVVRTAGDPLALARPIAAHVRALDPDMPLTDVMTGDDIIAASVAGRRFNTTIAGSFAGVAMLLAVVGIYGVLAHAVGQRTREIGVRMALGASAAEILTMVVRQGMVPIAAGLGAGLVGTMAVSRLIGGLLYEIDPLDTATLAIATGILCGSALLATVVPALRSLRVDPVVALRSD